MSARRARPEKETAGRETGTDRPWGVARGGDGAVARAWQSLPPACGTTQRYFDSRASHAINIAWSDGPAEFRAAAAAVGLELPVRLIPDGRFHRFSTRPDRPRDDAGWYVWHGDHGAVGDWRRAGAEPLIRWSARGGGRRIDTAEIARLRAASAAQRHESARRNARRRGDAAREAQDIWAAAAAAPADHGYLAAKGVQAHGLRVFQGAGNWRRKIGGLPLQGCLVVPLRDAAGTIQTVEFIGPAGKKRFLTGGRKQGCYYTIPGDSAAILLAEGYATGASLHEATGYTVVCAQDATNLRSVAQAQRAAHPDALILLAGDHDESGTGQRAAKEAAEAVHGLVAVPGRVGADWNDIHQAEGLEAVRAAIDDAVRVHIQGTPEGRTALTAAAPAVALSIGPRLASAMERAEQVPSAQDQTDIDQARSQIVDAIRGQLARIAAPAGEDSQASDSIIIRATVGVGKSSSAIAAIRGRLTDILEGKLRVLLVVNGHEQTARYASELTALGVSAMPYVGRTGPVDGVADDWHQPATTCWAMARVRQVADQHHPPAAAYCRQCPHGLRAAAEHAKSPAQQYEAHKKFLAACQRQGLDPTAVQPCKFLYEAMPSYLAAQVLVIPYQAYTDRLVRPEPDSPPCAVIVDEDIPLMREIPVTLTDIDQWRARIQRGEIHMLGRAAETDHPVIFDAFRALTTALGEHGKNPDTLAALRSVLDAVTEEYGDDLEHGATWAWERIRWITDDAGRETGEIDAPLRALATLRAALAGDGVAATWGDDLVLRLTETTTLGERVCAGDTVLLDATVDDDTIAALRARAARAGRKIDLLDVQVRQHASLTTLTGIGYTRGRRTDPWHAAMRSRQGLHVAAMIGAVSAARAGNAQRKLAILTHLPIERDAAVQQAIEEYGGPVEIGHWGRHERARNDWSGYDLVLVGLPYPSPAVIQMRWDRLRACDPTLPTTPSPEFATRLVAADVVQAVGRSRAIYAPPADPIQVIIAANVTPELRTALGKYGLRIAEERRNPLSGRAPRDEATVLRILIAELDRRRRDSDRDSTSRDALARACRAMGLHISTDAFDALLTSLVLPEERGGKRHRDPTRYVLLLLRRAREALRALDTAVRRTIEAATEGMDATLRLRVQRILEGLGDWLRLTLTFPRTGPPPHPAPA